MGRDQDAAKHPEVHTTALTANRVTQNVKGAGAENPVPDDTGACRTIMTYIHVSACYKRVDLFARL